MGWNESKIGVCLVGAGAVAEKYHIPTISVSARSAITCVVDVNEKRAIKIAAHLGVPHYSDFKYVPDAGICLVATPQNVREEVIIPALERGMHVFCEKPFAVSLESAQRMVCHAKKVGRRIFVGQMRRFFPNIELLCRIASTLELSGDVKLSCHEGGAFGWETASDYLTKLGPKDGGVLHDTGAHTIDIVVQILRSLKTGDEEISIADCIFDREYAPNTICARFVSCSEGKNVKVEVKISRIMSLSNRIVLHNDSIALSTCSTLDEKVHVFSRDEGGSFAIAAASDENRLPNVYDCFRRQWDEVLDAIVSPEGRMHTSRIDAETVLRTIQLIEGLAKRSRREDFDPYFCENSQWT